MLRRKAAAPPALFRVPAGLAVSVAALLLAGWLLSNVSGKQARDSAIAAVVEEAQPDLRSADELHDLLLELGALPETEAAPWTGYQGT